MLSSDILVSLKRTLVPIIVGAVAASALKQWVDIVLFEEIVASVISIVYYTVLRFLEVKVPAVGFLLGSRQQPVYLPEK
jgi:hypothetical protein